MRRIVFFILAIIALVVLFTVLAIRNRPNKWQSEYERQLRLARAEGIPTSMAEFAATVPTAAPSENAAVFYLKLKRPDTKLTSELDRVLAFHPQATDLKKGDEVLKLYGDNVRLLEQAVRLPKCWFNRDWSQGAAMLAPELGPIKFSATLLTIRGSMALSKGNTQAALQDVDRVFAIAAHLRQEPWLLSNLVSQEIYARGTYALAMWYLSHPNRKGFRDRLTRAVEEWRLPDPRLLSRTTLCQALDMVELCETRAGREQLGLREEDIGKMDSIAPFLLDRDEAKVRMVQAARRANKAYGLERKQQLLEFQEASQELLMAMLAYPTAASVFSALSDGYFENAETISKARRLQYMALARALGEQGPKSKIRTDDLLSPFDGKPVSYSYNGKQVVISVSGSGLPDLKLPPNSVLNRPHK